jgi:three-Cys-motif partner protein
MTNTSFFDKPTEQSLVKATIVDKYFLAWAKVIIPRAKKTYNKIGYIDLFSGPGRYQDGSKSTPILILEKAINHPDMQKMLVTKFNDADPQNTQLLQQEINCLPDLSKLAHKPIVSNDTVGDKILRELEATKKIIPTLFFIDPWGYKGLSLQLIAASIKNWGCDCIFFFNYNRINMGLNNELVKTHMNYIFGEDRADTLRVQLEPMKPFERELTIIEAICQALKEIGVVYSLPFRFKNQGRTSHHLFFASKNVLGYSIMKDIMAKESSSTEQGVPSFEYNPATINQPLLFELSRPLDELANMLMDEFAGQTLNREDIYNKHHVGRRYIEKNYREVLLQLESQNKIITQPPANKRKKGTLATTVSITFPSKEED